MPKQRQSGTLTQLQKTRRILSESKFLSIIIRD